MERTVFGIKYQQQNLCVLQHVLLPLLIAINMYMHCYDILFRLV